MKTVFCDWGTSNLRAYVLEHGKVVGEYSTPNGLLRAKELGFKNVLDDTFAALSLPIETPVRLSGMVGSKHGWKEAPYASTPATLESLQTNYVDIEDYPNVKIFGGVSHLIEDGRRDVMRGEEVQIFGILSKYPEAKTICLPGTHAKWVKADGGSIKSFTTWMTGDFFRSLSENTIFKEQITDKSFDKDAFLKGVESAKQATSILNSAFYLRTDYLFGQVNGAEFHSYLSGFLIGNEIKGAAENCDEVFLCGSELMTVYYQAALKCFGIESHVFLASEATVLGMQSITEEGSYV
jgi:2-dehydro-3-deoxygalactonokinase